MKKRVPDTTCLAVEGRYTQLVFLVLFFSFFAETYGWMNLNTLFLRTALLEQGY